MHPFPDALKEDLSIAPSILGGLLFLEVAAEFLFHIDGTSAALVNVVEDVAIRVGGGQRLDRHGKVAAKACFSPAMFALKTGVTNRTIFNLASSTDSILFGEVARLHLIEEHKQKVCDEFLVLHAHEREAWGLVHDWDITGSHFFHRHHVTGWVDEANSILRVHHTESNGGFFPVLSSSSRTRS